jgi:cytochrome c oxidase subunit II
MSSKSRRERELAHRRAEARRRAMRAAIFGLIVVSVLAVAGSLLFSAFSRPGLEALAGKVVDIAADMSGFDVEQVRLKAGEPVTVRLTSLDNKYHMDGGGQHQWAVDELDLNLVAQPLSSNTITFTPATPGTYTFYCDICCGGRANPTMQGILIVEA